MGTNFYMITKDKNKVLKYAPYDYEISDAPYFCYTFHVAKTSCGWLPLFQAHKEGIKCIKEYKEAYDNGCEIIDEYNSNYTWDEFSKRVLQFNGGTKNNRIIEIVKQDTNNTFYDPYMPNHIPVSHFEYANGLYSNTKYTDFDGYEFETLSFS